MFMGKITVKNMCRKFTVYLEVKFPALLLVSYMTLDKLLNIVKFVFTCEMGVKINLYRGMVLWTKFNEYIHAKFSSL